MPKNRPPAPPLSPAQRNVLRRALAGQELRQPVFTPNPPTVGGAPVGRATFRVLVRLSLVQRARWEPRVTPGGQLWRPTDKARQLLIEGRL